MYLPLNYEDINSIAGTYKPSCVKSFNNQTFEFWQRALYQRACSTLIITLPDEWKENKDFMYWCLFAYGFIGCGELPEIGKWFNPGNLKGYNFYYRPTTFLLCNPYFGKDPVTGKGISKELQIGTECQLIKLTPDYKGIWDIIFYYAEKIAVLDVAINSAIINSKFAYMIGSKNKAASEVMKKMFDQINAGQPAAFFDLKLANDATDKSEPWQFLDRNVKESYIITDLLRDFQTIINDFDTEIGIPTIPYEKKERMVADEATSKQYDATSRSQIWFDTLKNSFEIANDFLGFTGENKLDVELRFPLEGGADDGNSQNNINRNVSMDGTE